MGKGAISRRDLLGMGAGALATAGLAPLALTKTAYASGVGASSPIQEAEGFLSAINKAFAFQEMMMDAYATGDTVRLTQSIQTAASNQHRSRTTTPCRSMPICCTGPQTRCIARKFSAMD